MQSTRLPFLSDVTAFPSWIVMLLVVAVPGGDKCDGNASFVRSWRQTSRESRCCPTKFLGRLHLYSLKGSPALCLFRPSLHVRLGIFHIGLVHVRFTLQRYAGIAANVTAAMDESLRSILCEPESWTWEPFLNYYIKFNSEGTGEVTCRALPKAAFDVELTKHSSSASKSLHTSVP